MADTMRSERHEHDSVSRRDEVTQRMIDMADGKAGVPRTGPDDFSQRIASESFSLLRPECARHRPRTRHPILLSARRRK
jgi:hypothetical protein